MKRWLRACAAVIACQTLVTTVIADVETVTVLKDSKPQEIFLPKTDLPVGWKQHEKFSNDWHAKVYLPESAGYVATAYDLRGAYMTASAMPAAPWERDHGRDAFAKYIADENQLIRRAASSRIKIVQIASVTTADGSKLPIFAIGSPLRGCFQFAYLQDGEYFVKFKLAACTESERVNQEKASRAFQAWLASYRK